MYTQVEESFLMEFYKSRKQWYEKDACETNNSDRNRIRFVTSELQSELPGHPRSVLGGRGLMSCIYDANESNEKLFRRRCK